MMEFMTLYFYAIPGVLLVAGLVLRQSNYLIITCTALFSIGMIGYLETIGIIQNAFSVRTNWNDILDLEVMLSVTAITIWLLSDNLRKSIIRMRNRRARNSQTIRSIENL